MSFGGYENRKHSASEHHCSGVSNSNRKNLKIGVLGFRRLKCRAVKFAAASLKVVETCPCKNKPAVRLNIYRVIDSTVRVNIWSNSNVVIVKMKM